MKPMPGLTSMFAPCALLLQWALVSPSFAASPVVQAPTPVQEAAPPESQSNPAAPNRQAPASTTPAEQTAAAPSDQEPDTQPEAPSAAEGEASPQRFVPSEQVRADFDVSFPIDT